MERKGRETDRTEAKQAPPRDDACVEHILQRCIISWKLCPCVHFTPADRVTHFHKMYHIS